MPLILHPQGPTPSRPCPTLRKRLHVYGGSGPVPRTPSANIGSTRVGACTPHAQLPDHTHPGDTPERLVHRHLQGLVEGTRTGPGPTWEVGPQSFTPLRDGPAVCKTRRSGGSLYPLGTSGDEPSPTSFRRDPTLHVYPRVGNHTSPGGLWRVGFPPERRDGTGQAPPTTVPHLTPDTPVAPLSTGRDGRDPTGYPQPGVTSWVVRPLQWLTRVR